METLGGKNAPKASRPLIAHAWTDYVPSSFVEPHSFLVEDPSYRSINLVANLWDNGKSVDDYTHFLREQNSKNLVSPTYLYRLRTRLERNWRQASFLNMCRRHIHRLDISLVHSHFGTTGCELAPTLDKLGIPHVVTIYGYDGSAALRNPRLLAKYKRMFTAADRIIVLSNVVKQRFVDLGCSSSLLSVWNMPAGVEFFPYLPKARKNTIRLLMAARFAEAKGHVYLLEGLRILIKKNYSVRLTLVGYGNQAALIEKKIAALGLRPYVSLINNNLSGDFHSDFYGLIKDSDIYIAPSIQDRFGTDEAGPSLTAVCAQAAGMPVVCTPFPGSEISVIDGHTGLYCQEKSASSLAEKIEALILDPNLALRLGRNASHLVNREFSQEGQLRKLIAIYDSCLNQNTEIRSQRKEQAQTLGKTLHFPDRHVNSDADLCH